MPQLEPKTSWSNCRSIIHSASQTDHTPTMWSLRGRQLFWFSCRRPTRSPLDKSPTTTSKRRSRGSHAYHRPTRGIPAFSPSKIVEILSKVRELQSTSCPPEKVDMMTSGIIGADRFPFEEMCMSMNEKSSNSTVRPRVTRFIWIVWNTGSCQRNQPFIDTTSTCRSSISSPPLRLTCKPLMDGMYTGEMMSLTLSSSARRQAL